MEKFKQDSLEEQIELVAEKHAENLQFAKVCPGCKQEFPANSELTNCPQDKMLLAPVSTALMGSIIDERYEIIRLLATGAWSEVYLARQAQLDKEIALKILHLNLVSDPARVQRFEEEARAVSSLKDPSIVAVHDYGLSADGRPYIAMDYIKGISLADLASARHLETNASCNYVIQLARALGQAHSKGIIHRDIKPANIIISESGSHLLDFGIAKTLQNTERADVTRTGEILGTPAYMSPEQCRALEIDARSDIYSLGVVFHEMLAGERLVKENSSYACMKWHLNEVPPEIYSVSPELSAVVQKMLEKDPGNRYQNTEELVADIESAVRGERTIARPKKQDWRAAYAIVAALLLLLLCVYFQPKTKTPPVMPAPQYPANYTSTAPYSAASTRASQVEELANKNYPVQEIQKRFQKLDNYVYSMGARGKFGEIAKLSSKLQVYKDMYENRAELPETELPQTMVASLLNGNGFEVPGFASSAEVDLGFTKGPLVLVLNAHGPTHWKLNLKPGVQLERVVLKGPAECTLDNPPPDVELVDQSGNKKVSPSALAPAFGNDEYQAASRKTMGANNETRFDMNFTTLNAEYSRPGVKIVIGPDNQNWRAQYVMHLMEKLYQNEEGVAFPVK